MRALQDQYASPEVSAPVQKSLHCQTRLSTFTFRTETEQAPCTGQVTYDKKDLSGDPGCDQLL